MSKAVQLRNRLYAAMHNVEAALNTMRDIERELDALVIDERATKRKKDASLPKLQRANDPRVAKLKTIVTDYFGKPITFYNDRSRRTGIRSVKIAWALNAAERGDLIAVIQRAFPEATFKAVNTPRMGLRHLKGSGGDKYVRVVFPNIEGTK